MSTEPAEVAESAPISSVPQVAVPVHEDWKVNLWAWLETVGKRAGFTTFSAFSLDTAILCERGEPKLAAIYVAASVFLSIARLFSTTWVARAFMLQ